MARTEAIELIEPDWPAPAHVGACSTTRRGGFSQGPFASLNLGAHVGDDPSRVERNRAALAARLEDALAPVWLEQVHGTRIVAADAVSGAADGAFTTRAGTACAVLTADCLPVLLCSGDGQAVAAVHCGWRGLAGGIVERAVEQLECTAGGADGLLAWLGPAIGPDAYEVGDDVRQCFTAAGDAVAFRRNDRGRWQCDLYALARSRLAATGIGRIFGGTRCTLTERETFFSHRRDGSCGRQATLVWLKSSATAPSSDY